MPRPHAARPAKLPRPAPKQYTPEELRDLGQRAREVSRRLHEVTEQMNEALCAVEDAFLERLGEGARGRVELQRGTTKKREWVEFLVYRDGEFFVESNRGGPRFELTHMLSTSRDCRKLICGKIADLWLACGGKPLVGHAPSR